MLLIILGSNLTNPCGSSHIITGMGFSSCVKEGREKGEEGFHGGDVIVCLLVLGMDGVFMVFTVLLLKVSKINKRAMHGAMLIMCHRPRIIIISIQYSYNNNNKKKSSPVLKDKKSIFYILHLTLKS